MGSMRRIEAPVAVTVSSKGRPVAFLWCGLRYRISVLDTRPLSVYWWDDPGHADRTYWRVVTRDHHVFDLSHEASTGAWVLNIAYDWYTRQPVPEITRVDFFTMNPGATSTLYGTVRMGPDGHLVYDDEGIEELVEELRYDSAFGREWRPLTDAELLAHLPLRPLGYMWCEAYNAHGEWVDTSGILLPDREDQTKLGLPTGVTCGRSVLVLGTPEPSYTADDVGCLWCGRTIPSGESFTCPAPALQPVCERCRLFE